MTDLPKRVTVSWVVISEVTVETCRTDDNILVQRQREPRVTSVTVVVVKVVVGRGGLGAGGYLRLGISP